MDTALVRPPSPTYTAITPVTRAPEKDQPASSTDLPAEDTVRPSADSTGSQRAATNEQNRASEGRADQSALERYTPPVTRQNVFDEDSESLIYVATNTETGDVIRQIPSETLLRLRAYSETVAAYRTQVEEQQRSSSQDEAVQRTV
ncbi:flagellar protein FlaG [Labrenzia sp. R4_2]|uniref:flagellar protein FlaG n=1 Tax=Labrenzia sp. R4_2 TaxID=2821107 RepID=UPI001ADAA706|nr:flagellar protein FlaG [Labrenzia sp. R4_2]MBO9419901.1 flagellar protein FlaG [Labrenzia sp. R4_2]